MDWDQFDMNPKVIAAVKKANIKSIKEILNLSGADLQRLTKLSSMDVQCLLKTVSGTLRKSCVLTALQLYQDKDHCTSQHQKLSLGCSLLDSLLRGGIPVVGITELAGESSAGKTQISLQLCLSVQYPYEYGGLESGAVYICTEDVFPNKRLQQLIDQQHKFRADVPLDVIQKIKFGNSVFIEHAADLVMDAVDETDVAQSNFGLLDKNVSPALGLTWSNQLLMRLMASRTTQSEQSPGGALQHTGSVLRTLSVVFAPHLPQSFCCYAVNLEGVKGVKVKTPL
ncbi:DNA repair protein XRCC3 isoform X3 [Chelonia mydas]|uniref:DNA repair protein XRCC3 isoform X3 n=1 Tax=Chelonia mydas TaxID=8469 RepID=UPI0018A20D8E|nr:DNA repair protein XRCC3 isoform X3 [Chelonia mydas]